MKSLGRQPCSRASREYRGRRGRDGAEGKLSHLASIVIPAKGNPDFLELISGTRLRGGDEARKLPRGDPHRQRGEDAAARRFEAPGARKPSRTGRPADARAVDDPERLPGEITSAIDRAPMVIVGGGDGTLSETVDHFLKRDTVFALLPLGTANSFARTLGIPLDLDGAVEVVANGEARRIDLAAINGDYFLNNAALGLAPVVAESVPGALKRSFGRLGYLLWAGWSAANFAHSVDVEDSRDGKPWRQKADRNGRFPG